MSMVCPKCGYERAFDEVVPEYECPRCGVVYQKYAEWKEKYAPEPPAAGPAAPAGPEGSSVAEVHEEESVAPDTRPHGQWRLVALVVALFIVVAVAALTTRQRAITSGTASWNDFPYDIRGTWEGRVVETIDLRDRPAYEAEYAARFTVDEDYRLVEMEWTAGHFLLKEETVLWQWPSTITCTSRRRSGASASFLEPPRGAYTEITIEDGMLFLASHQEGSSSLPLFEAEFVIPGSTPRELWSNGGFSPLRDEGAIEAVARGGIPKFGPVELNPDEMTIELPEAAAALAFRPYLQGVKSWPDGVPADPKQPCEGLDLDGLSIVDLPDVTCSIRPVRAQLTGKYRRPDEPTEPGEGDWVEMLPESRLFLTMDRAIGWSAHVLFYKDGNVVVRLPNRDLEIPVERIGGAPMAQGLETNER